MMTSSTTHASGITETYIVKIGQALTILALFLATQTTETLMPSGLAKPVTANDDSAKIAKPRRLMIPPPPPDIPLIGGKSMEFSSSGVPLDFLNKADLEKLKQRLSQSLDQLNKRAQDRRSNIAEYEARLTQFETLYTEGVVSKKDIAGIKKELTAAKEADNDIEQRLSDTQADLARVEKRLKVLTATQVKPAIKNKKPAAETKGKSAPPPLQNQTKL